MFEAAGVRGVLRVGVKNAFTLGRWTMVRYPSNTIGTHPPTAIDATIVARYPMWSDVRPLTLWLDFGRHWWGWEAAHLSIDGQRIHIDTIGRPTIREHLHGQEQI